MGFMIMQAADGKTEILGDEYGQMQARKFLQQRAGNGYRNDRGEWVSEKQIRESEQQVNGE